MSVEVLKQLAAKWRDDAAATRKKAALLDGCNGREHNPEKRYHLNLVAEQQLMDANELDAVIAAIPSPQTWQQQEALLHPATQVFFRAGLIACREYMARFVEAESPSIAMSIRANWWPSLGPDFGPPRKLDWAEVTHGEFDTPEFRAKTAEELLPTQEALPIALGFLETQSVASPRGGPAKESLE